MYLIGYLSALSCRAGESVDVMIGSSVSDVSVDVVRLIHGDDNPLGPGFIYQPVDQIAVQQVHASEQQTPIGSWAVSQKAIHLPSASSLQLSLSVWPTLPPAQGLQGIVSLPGLDLLLALDSESRLVFSCEGQTLLTTPPVPLRQWRHIALELSAEKSWISLNDNDELPLYFTGPGREAAGSSEVLIAAISVKKHGEQHFPEGVYNGKIARPLLAVDGQPLASWAFENAMSTQSVADISGNGCDLKLVNAPTRAMTGPDWRNDVHDWKQEPSQYDAIHFHDDDLADACWPVTTSVTLPESLPSGAYAVRLRANGLNDDYIPLVIRPPLGKPSGARIAMVMATYTYIAYANEHLTEGDFEQGSEIPVETGNWEDLVALHQEWGKSHYDLHNDGSGVAYSSSLRPIPNMRPDYRFWGFHAPRRFSADLYMVWFLTQRDEPFDVITEHDLHAESASVLKNYQTVITGSHPEYYSAPMLDAFEQHVKDGGGLMYLGGDGFYWVTTPFDGLPHLLEVRKSEGLRHWDAEPGERYHASTGELGGIWRSRGRSAHRLFGVGMGAHGWDNKAPGYRRSERSYQPDAAWVFAGIEEQVVGDFGLIMNGTSGDEIDRADVHYGTPADAIILATSEPHSEWYVPVPEDVTTVSNQLNARYNRNVRSDMVLVEHSGGGAVFSVGSIIFTGALPVNNGDNNIARLLENIIHNFTARQKQ
ncbi:N,N-dimethylformamidase beta subunit family domain-containing protein [Erwinia typographi]|uniref:N,N-dimethylformamidase beta subunit family domain-containing protein n=1 Tax=Erwinia typographi TaxID=371042 RepID=UPI000689361D|nr:N,N-dimethylformamidase beta subunit family domain-containing protein [Erwinia typographi]